MSEKSVSSQGSGEARHRLPRQRLRVSAGALVLGVLGAGIAVEASYFFAPMSSSRAEGSPELSSDLQQSKIVTGIPGQVEADNGHQLLIEQCPEDLAGARSGHPTESFDPRIGHHADNCNVDWVADPYERFKPGAVITFLGPEPNMHLSK